ncbi:Ldh family oxidoreductase [Halorarius litoreus]|uniref:Ldh family oxidoreductase n=1 Tax=Halorarius litoreus TaxID=2962676 RepID=UPI0020CE017B|nr:Ldh family oxidoreductase [Halorarius litoreus]
MTVRFDQTTLRAFSRDILDGLGGPPETARLVTESLVRADLRGYGTHGIGILPLYAGMVDDGAIDPLATPTVDRGDGATVRVDGQTGFGQLAAREATAEGIAVAEEYGVSVVGLRDASHIGPVGEFAERAAEAGMVFLAFTNTAGGATNTAAFGGAARTLSTNPVAFGVPTFDALPYDIVADFATSQVSGSVIRDHHRTGEPLDDEWTTTPSGDPVESPAAFMAGEGALLPLGGRTTGHKGYALSVVAELLGGLIGRNPVVGENDPEWLANGGAFVLVDPTAFLSVAAIEDRIGQFAAHLHREAGVRLPGEGAHQRTQTNRSEGIEIPEHDLVPLAETAAGVGVTPPAEIRAALDGAEDVDDDLQTW